MKTAGCILAVWVVCAAHWPHTTVAVTLAALGLWLWLTTRETTRARAARYSCRSPGCSYASATARNVARHEAAHAVQYEHEGCPVEAIGIGSDGSGVTIPRFYNVDDEAALRIAVSGTLGEGSGWFGEYPINGSSWSKTSDRSKANRLAKRIAARTGETPNEVIARAQRQSRRTLRNRAARFHNLAARLEDAFDSDADGRHEGWLRNP